MLAHIFFQNLNMSFYYFLSSIISIVKSVISLVFVSLKSYVFCISFGLLWLFPSNIAFELFYSNVLRCDLFLFILFIISRASRVWAEMHFVILILGRFCSKYLSPLSFKDPTYIYFEDLFFFNQFWCFIFFFCTLFQRLFSVFYSLYFL